jgi:hypothetical protein
MSWIEVPGFKDWLDLYEAVVADPGLVTRAGCPSHSTLYVGAARG